MLQNKNYFNSCQITIYALVIYLTLSEPSFAANLNLNTLHSVFQDILAALTGTFGKTLATIAFAGAFVLWWFSYVEWKTVIYIIISIVGVSSSVAFVDSIWGTAA